MWPFRRKKSNKSTLPNEVKDYYQAERRERVGVAWLLALATLVTTVILAIGIYYGGRWVYRKIKNDKPKNVTTNNQPKQNTGSNNTNQSPQPDATNNSNGTNTSPSNPQTNTPNNGNQGTSSPPNTPTPTPPTPAQTPRPNPGTTSIPNTGPGDTIAIFLGSSFVAGMGHHLITRRRTQKR
jgi:hypothetical protein